MRNKGQRQNDVNKTQSLVLVAAAVSPLLNLCGQLEIPPLLIQSKHCIDCEAGYYSVIVGAIQRKTVKQMSSIVRFDPTVIDAM